MVSHRRSTGSKVGLIVLQITDCKLIQDKNSDAKRSRSKIQLTDFHHIVINRVMGCCGRSLFHISARMYIATFSVWNCGPIIILI